MSIAKYTFVPWLRRGLSAEITTVDHLGAGSGGPTERTELPVALTVRYVDRAGTTRTPDAISQAIELLGPGDVVGLRPEAILRTEPAAGTTAFETGALPYVEFYEEDFPWRYTPGRPIRDGEADPGNRRHRLRPWLALWVLQDDEFTLLPDRAGKPPAIALEPTTVVRALPPHDETWAWAHVQVSRGLAASGVAGAIEQAPDHALARLVCPRRLAANTTYHAFLVPAFEVGRLAGLGEPTADVAAQDPSWRTGTPSAMPHSTVRAYQYPIYHRWTFRTSDDGDFESLVERLQAGPAGAAFGKRKLDVRTPGYGMDGLSGAPATVELEGALQPVNLDRTAFPYATGTAFNDRLEAVLDLSSRLEAGTAMPPALSTHPFHVPGADGAYASTMPDDPIVTPPAFGKRHALVASLADTAGQPARAWLRELNLDPRYRAVAGIGVQVVQERQEELMERAWQQVGDLDRANQRLREAELAVAVGEAMFAKHLRRDDAESALRLTSAAHGRVLASGGATTLRASVASSQVPAAAQSPAFKRITRPQRKVMRRLGGNGNVGGAIHSRLVTNFNRQSGALTAAPPAATPSTAMAFGTVFGAVAASVTEYQSEGAKAGHVFLEILVEELAGRVTSPPTAPNVGAVQSGLRSRVDQPRTPAPTAEARAQMRAMIDDIIAITAPGPSQFVVTLRLFRFNAMYGAAIAGKSFRGVTVVREGSGPVTDPAAMTDLAEVTEFRNAVDAMTSLVSTRMTPPAAPPRLPGVSSEAERVLQAMRPRTSIAQRVKRTMSGIPFVPDQQARPLRPVMAHPEFPDAMFEDLRARSQDFIIPNYGDLPADTITILAPNQRFIEAYLAGLNDEMARELLWREYPTDQRGTYFRRFWDTRDDITAGANPPGDIRRMHEWSGALGAQAARSGAFLVLVIRGELLRKYPDTVVYAQRAQFAPGSNSAPRGLAPEATAGNLLFPTFRGRLDPDIALFGFPLGIDAARGRRQAPNADPGWFFVLRERPGEVRLGLDEVAGSPPSMPLASWNQLAWQHLSFPASCPDHIRIAGNNPTVVTTPQTPGEPPVPRDGIWGRTAADLATILVQSPVLYARHAEELLPPPGTTP
jgi:hypothetical protein